MLGKIWDGVARRLTARMLPEVIEALREKNIDARDHISALASPKVETAVPLLPKGYVPLHLVDGAGQPFTLIRTEPPGEYEKGLISGHNWGTTDVIWLLRHLLENGGTLIDVGANIGAVSIPIALDGTPVVSIEMLPTNALKLQLAVLANGLHNMRVFQTGASSTDGILQFGGGEAWGSVGQGTSTATAMRLDTVMALASSFPQMTSSLVIKIDVEGHELDVLRGATSTIAKYRPVILFESIETVGDNAQTSKRCKSLLENLGYSLFLQRGHMLVPRTSADLQEGYVVDFLAVPHEKIGMIGDLDIGHMQPSDRVHYAYELSLVEEVGHRLHAVSLISELRAEDKIYIPLTSFILHSLSLKNDCVVGEKARKLLLDAGEIQ